LAIGIAGDTSDATDDDLSLMAACQRWSWGRSRRSKRRRVGVFMRRRPGAPVARAPGAGQPVHAAGHESDHEFN